MIVVFLANSAESGVTISLRPFSDTTGTAASSYTCIEVAPTVYESANVTGLTGTWQVLAINSGSEPVYSGYVTFNGSAKYAAVDSPTIVTVGSGARTVMVTVTANGQPVQGATVRLTKSVESYTSATNASGQTTFNVNDGTWQVAITAPNASFAGASLLVDGDKTPTYTMTVATPPTSDLPSAATGTYLCVSSANAPEPGVRLFVQLIRGPGQPGNTFSSPIRRETSGNDGTAYFTNLIRGATYRVWRNYEAASSNAAEFTVPQTGEFFQLPEIL